MNYPSTIQINGSIYDIEYSLTRKFSSSVRIKNGKVVVILSRFLTGDTRDKTVEKFLKWAEKKLFRVKHETFSFPKYIDGEKIFAHNKAYEIKVTSSKRQNLRVKISNENVIEIFLPDNFSGSEKNERIKFLCEKAIMEDQTSYLTEIVDGINNAYFRERYRSCRFKRSMSRFGSLSSKKNINISMRLLFAPVDVFHYVCVHELAHLKEFNHSKRFWNHVALAMPNYKESEKWLKDNGFFLG